MTARAPVNQTIGSLTTSGTGSATDAVVGGGNASISTLTVSYSGTSTDTFAGVIGGTGTNQNAVNLTKSGAGTLLLTGSNSYTGGTSISGGTLEIKNNSLALGSNVAGNTITLGGGVLELTNGTTAQVYNQAINLTGASTIETDAAFTQTFTLNGNINNGGNLLTDSVS